MKTIIIDPGHGGSDPGAVAYDLQEKDLTLQISKLIKIYLENTYKNVGVFLTRDSDKFIELIQRSSFANAKNADVFLSIHINAGFGTGYESFVYESPSPGSLQFQSYLHDGMKSILDEYKLVDRGQKRADYSVLRNTNNPAVLSEILFIDNPVNADRLKNDQFILDVAHAHAKAIAKFLSLELKAMENYSPSNKDMLNASISVLKRLEDKENGISSTHREKLLEGNLSVSDAIAILYVALYRQLLDK